MSSDSNSSSVEKATVAILEHQSPATFTLFSSLAPEIRDRIWELALPGPRVLHVQGTGKTDGPSRSYTTRNFSYGGTHPTVLSVNRESRAEAQRHLTWRFNAWWNLETDYLYIGAERWGAETSRNQLSDMRKKGLLDDVQYMALDSDVWSGYGPGQSEHVLDSICALPNLKQCTFIISYRDWHLDVLNPGKSWTLLPVNSSAKTEFPSHDSWCRPKRAFASRMKDDIAKHLISHKIQWQARKKPGPVMDISVIENRTMVKKPWSTPAYYEPPWADWFG